MIEKMNIRTVNYDGLDKVEMVDKINELIEEFERLKATFELDDFPPNVCGISTNYTEVPPTVEKDTKLAEETPDQRTRRIEKAWAEASGGDPELFRAIGRLDSISWVDAGIPDALEHYRYIKQALTKKGLV